MENTKSQSQAIHLSYGSTRFFWGKIFVARCGLQLPVNSSRREELDLDPDLDPDLALTLVRQGEALRDSDWVRRYWRRLRSRVGVTYSRGQPRDLANWRRGMRQGRGRRDDTQPNPNHLIFKRWVNLCILCNLFNSLYLHLYLHIYSYLKIILKENQNWIIKLQI